jgi:hypothetical protein
MLLLCVGWYLPLPIPFNKIPLPTQKLRSYPTRKLTTHMLPYPKNHPKSHNSHAIFPNHTFEIMSSPSKVVAWECGTCAYTNVDATHRICLGCQVRHPVRYAIVAGAAAAMRARTTRVGCLEQARNAALATAWPPIVGEAATSTNVAIPREAPIAAYGPSAMAESAAMYP